MFMLSCLFSLYHHPLLSPEPFEAGGSAGGPSSPLLLITSYKIIHIEIQEHLVDWESFALLGFYVYFGRIMCSALHFFG